MPSSVSSALLLLYAYPVLVTIAPPAISYVHRDRANETADMMLLVLLTVYLVGLLKVPWDLHRLTCHQLHSAMLALEQSSLKPLHDDKPLTTTTVPLTASPHQHSWSLHSVQTLRFLSYLYLFLTFASPFLGGWIVYITKAALPASSSLKYIHPAHFIFASSLLPLLHLSNLAKSTTGRIGSGLDEDVQTKSLNPLSTNSSTSYSSYSSSSSSSVPYADLRHTPDWLKRQIEQTKQIIALEKTLGQLTRRLDRLCQSSTASSQSFQATSVPCSDNTMSTNVAMTSTTSSFNKNALKRSITPPSVSKLATIRSYIFWGIHFYLSNLLAFLLLPFTIFAWSLRHVRWLLSDTSMFDEVDDSTVPVNNHDKVSLTSIQGFGENLQDGEVLSSRSVSTSENEKANREENEIHRNRHALHHHYHHNNCTIHHRRRCGLAGNRSTSDSSITERELDKNSRPLFKLSSSFFPRMWSSPTTNTTHLVTKTGTLTRTNAVSPISRMKDPLHNLTPVN